TARDQDFPSGSRRPQDAALPINDGLRPAPVEHNPLGRRRRLDAKVAAVSCGAKIGDRRARPPAVTRRGLEETGALLRGTVEIAIERQPGLDGCCDESRRKWIGMPQIGNRQRAARAVKVIRAALLVFGLFEIGQDIVEAPALIAALAPTIIVGMLAADIKQTVDRTRSPEHLAARLEHASPVQF